MNPRFCDGEAVMASAPRSERRVEVRFRPVREAGCEVEAIDKEDRWPAVVRDLSRHGVGLVLERRFSPGTILEVELRQPELVREVRVVQVTKLAANQWLLGCTLNVPLAPADLRRLIGEDSPGTS
jgi:hypothetical protein